jgi:hypothetical protein
VRDRAAFAADEETSLWLFDELRTVSERFPVETLIAEAGVDFDVPFLRGLIDHDDGATREALEDAP